MDDDAKSATIAAAMKLFDVAIRVSIPPLLGVAGWAYTSINDLQGRVHYIEQTRYTQEDRDKDMGGVNSALQIVIVNQAVTSSKLDAIEKKLDRGNVP